MIFNGWYKYKNKDDLILKRERKKKLYIKICMYFVWTMYISSNRDKNNVFFFFFKCILTAIVPMMPNMYREGNPTP